MRSRLRALNPFGIAHTETNKSSVATTSATAAPPSEISLSNNLTDATTVAAARSETTSARGA